MNCSDHPIDMRYGQLASNKRINRTIYRCFQYLMPEDEHRFLRAFREQAHGSYQAMHTFRELILGAYLISSGFSARYEYLVGDQTPDWCIMDDEGVIISVVELMNFHVDKATEYEIDRQWKDRSIAAVWRDANKNNVDRLYHCIWRKAQVYRHLVEKLAAPYVIGVFADLRAALDLEEVRTCLLNDGSGIFEMYPAVSGLLYFEESCGRYPFRYIHNSLALRSMDLPDGRFPST